MSTVVDFLWVFRSRLLTFLTSVKYGFERDVREALNRIHGRVFWDIGADVGQYSLLLHKNFTEINAVEPNPSALRVLKLKIRLSRLKKINVYPIAMSNADGKTNFYMGPKTNFFSVHIYPGSLLKRFEFRSSNPAADMDYQGQNSIAVQTAKFDSLSRGTVDLVKVDVEGAEFLVLEGMRDTLQRKMIRNLLVELHDRNRRNELESLLSKYDYSLKWIDKDHLLASMEQS